MEIEQSAVGTLRECQDLGVMVCQRARRQRYPKDRELKRRIRLWGRSLHLSLDLQCEQLVRHLLTLGLELEGTVRIRDGEANQSQMEARGHEVDEAVIQVLVP